MTNECPVFCFPTCLVSSCDKWDSLAPLYYNILRCNVNVVKKRQSDHSRCGLVLRIHKGISTKKCHLWRLDEVNVFSPFDTFLSNRNLYKRSQFFFLLKTNIPRLPVSLSSPSHHWLSLASPVNNSWCRRTRPPRPPPRSTPPGSSAWCSAGLGSASRGASKVDRIGLGLDHQ